MLGFRNALAAFLGWTCLSISCTSTKAPQSRPLAEASDWDFCATQGLASDPQAPKLWSAATVQAQLAALRAEAEMGTSPWGAYTVAYQKMTAARDKERCEGRLVSQDPFMNQLNHLLSDVMTRWFVTITRHCLKGAYQDESGFCSLMERIKSEDYDALSAAMASTGVYLSSHLALSLAATAYVDDFWDASPYPETHSSSDFPREARMARLRAFKPTYDQFNSFLADQLTLVSSALDEAQMIKGSSLSVVTGMARYLPFRASLFGRIRDDAFRTALEIVAKQEPRSHPMVAKGGKRLTLDHGRYERQRLNEPKLLAIEDFSLRAVAGPTSIKIYRNLLGGKSWDELVKDQEIKTDLEGS